MLLDEKLDPRRVDGVREAREGQRTSTPSRASMTAESNVQPFGEFIGRRFSCRPVAYLPEYLDTRTPSSWSHGVAANARANALRRINLLLRSLHLYTKREAQIATFSCEKCLPFCSPRGKLLIKSDQDMLRPEASHDSLSSVKATHFSRRFRYGCEFTRKILLHFCAM